MDESSKKVQGFAVAAAFAVRAAAISAYLLQLTCLAGLALADATPHGNGTPTKWTVPRTGYEILIGASVLDPASGLPPLALLRAIVSWLSRETGLPNTNDLPRVAFATPMQMSALRYAFVVSDPDHDSMDGSAEVVSLYDSVNRTILLPLGWTGKSPAELSELVHEIVHHLQTAAGLKYGCPEDREAPAYEAQEKWLEPFGTSLVEQFGIDGLTLLARTHCLM